MAEIKNRRAGVYVNSTNDVVNKPYSLIYDETVDESKTEIIVQLPSCNNVLILLEKTASGSSMTYSIMIPNYEDAVIVGSSGASFQSIKVWIERGRLFSQLAAGSSISASSNVSTRTMYGSGYFECDTISKLRIASSNIEVGTKIKILAC